MTKKERFEKVLHYFQIERPVAETELEYASPYELLVAVILSAQCTDKRVNLTTPSFFAEFPVAEALAASTPEQVYPFIKSISYPNNKAKHLVGMARMLVHEFKNEVPADVELLQKLPGVGRKTANVIASVVFNMPAMAVDTHVFRVSARIGLTIGAKNPLQTERQLIKYIPENLVSIAHHWLILHGRYTCTARNPHCTECGLKLLCRYYEKNKLKIMRV
ncbi:MAG: endonuclease III [Bacteroidetes bacterium]|nr:endonuclease III [Bacteroidota bacterium]MBL0139442.1 endonuclease III [Bacteroidota bacterium]